MAKSGRDGTTPSSRGALSPSPLALLNHFAHIGTWTYLELIAGQNVRRTYVLPIGQLEETVTVSE